MIKWIAILAKISCLFNPVARRFFRS